MSDHTIMIIWVMKIFLYSASVYSSQVQRLCHAKALDCVDHNKLWKILKELGIFIVSVYKYKEFLCINFMSGDFNSLIKTNDFLVAPLEVSV